MKIKKISPTNLFLLNNKIAHLQQDPPFKFKNVGNHYSIKRNYICISNNIEPYIRSLPKLKELTLRNVESLPPEFEELKHIEKLSIYSSRLNYFPESIFKLTNLKKLCIRGNHFDGMKNVPDSIGELKNLKTLEISNVGIEHLPESMGNLVKLEVVNLNENKINRLPDSFGNLVNIKYLSLYSNKLNELPSQLSQLKSLEFLNVESNPLDSSQRDYPDIWDKFAHDYSGSICDISEAGFRRKIEYEFNNMLSVIWERDDEKCVRCGKENGLQFAVIRGHSKKKYYCVADLQLLCVKCYGKRRNKFDGLIGYDELESEIM